MNKKLSEMSAGQSGLVTRVTAEARIKRRLFDMGVTPGAEGYLRKSAALGDPLEVNIRGYGLTPRNPEAETVIMEVL